MVAALPLVWIVWLPPSPDLAAQVYRIHLFSLDGLSVWDNHWYAGHYLLDYSVLFPPVAAALGLRWVGLAAVTLSSLAFWRLARRHLPRQPALATALFAVGATGDLFIGRVTFALGVTFGLGAALSASMGRRWSAAALSLGCAAASPVAAAFLVLVAAADLITHRRAIRAAVLGLPALGLTVMLSLLFPEGGSESFGFLSLLAAAGLSLLLMVALPPRERLLRRGIALYVLAVLACGVVRSPMGSNIVRLGVLLEPALLVGAVGVEDVRRAVSGAAARLRRGGLLPRRAHDWSAPRGVARLVLSLMAAGLVLWQINGPIVQSVQAASDPSSNPAYYRSVERFLTAQGGPMRVEVPFTRSHWETTFLGGDFVLARGWERQLDSKYDALFYAPRLTAGAYHAWLLSTAVSFVALPDAPLDVSSRQEAALIRAGLPFLRQVFSTDHWRVYAVVGAQPLASGPGRLSAMDDDGFTLQAHTPGAFVVRVRYTPYWAATSGAASVSEAPSGWTEVTVRRAGSVDIDARFSLAASA